MSVTPVPSNSEDRYWILEGVDKSDPSKIRAVAEAASPQENGKPFPMVGLVDEQVGGVIGYLHGDYADDICTALNSREIDANYEQERG